MNMFVLDGNFAMISELAVEWGVDKLKTRCLEHRFVYSTEDGVIFGLRVACEWGSKDLVNGRNSESSFLCVCVCVCVCVFGRLRTS
jgi:hypothetical protein